MSSNSREWWGEFNLHIGEALERRIGNLLGAAGILSVAIGFASQTSASNLISGLFLLSERPFGVGDIIVYRFGNYSFPCQSGK